MKGIGRNTQVLAGIGALVVVGAGILVTTRSDGGGGAADKVRLEPIDASHPDDFTDDLDLGELGARIGLDQVSTPQGEHPPGGVLAGTETPGSEPGLYGGTRDQAVCDVQRLLGFLTDPTNAAKTAAWADVLGLETSQIPDYIATLTAVRLGFDTRVTNHGYRDGRATSLQSVLQAGTGVLVDVHGVPRVKCNCGNPLLEPEVLGQIDGSASRDVARHAVNPQDAWDGLDATSIVMVDRGGKVDGLVLQSPVDDTLFLRPVGSNGDRDADVPARDKPSACERHPDSPTCAGVVPPEETGATTTSAAPPPPPDENAAVTDAYLRFWDAILAATAASDADHPGLAATAVGAALDEGRSIVQHDQAVPAHRSGSVGHTIGSVTVTGDSATVVDCVDMSGWAIIDDATGENLTAGALGSRSGTYTLTRQPDGSWKVSTGSPQGEC